MKLTPAKPLLGLVALVSALALFAPACSSSDGSASSTTGATGTEPKVSEVWARQVMDNGAVYMTITGGTEADALTKAEAPSDIAGMTQIHETVMADSPSTSAMAGDSMGEEPSTSMGGSMGAMSMQEVDKVEIPAGEVVQLKPGGFHIMLMGMKKELKAGDTFDVTLTFEKAGTMKVTATVKAL
jgi:copper(I)-binding protein